MSIETKLEKVSDPADPRRCQCMVKSQQCPFKAEEGLTVCAMHKASADQNEEIKNANMYRLAKWQARVNEFAENDKVKSLRDEIGISRMLLEEIISKCDDSNSLILYSTKIADLVTRIEKLVSSCHRLESATGMLLDKSTALGIGMKIVDIISKYINDEAVIEKIGNDIVKDILCYSPVKEAV